MTDSRLPLDNVRVVDFSWIVAGPQATRILADLGADVIRVEYPGRVDSVRMGNPVAGAPPGSVDHSGMFSNFNRNKRSATLNVMHPAGMALLHDLIRVSDVVIENFSPRVLEGWGLTYETMAAINPAIIYISLSGFGHTGRDREYVTWGPTAQAVSGLTAMSGLPGMPPAGWGFSYLDHTAGYYGAFAIQMALYHREQTGEGQYIDMAQVETGMVLAGTQILDYAVNGRGYLASGGPPGNRSREPQIAPHNSYRCRSEARGAASDEAEPDAQRSDRWVTIVCETEEQWQALCRVAARPEWAKDKRFRTNRLRYEHQDALDAAIESWTCTLDAYDVMERLQAAGVPAGVVQNQRDKSERDPQLRARGFYRRADHPTLGEHEYEGLPFSLSHATWSVRRGGPLLGEHTAEVYGALLGRSEAEIATLAEEAAI
jgi:crotonobetainyl-CoA:carnitine CoA-transferase CaiB-like acyl-CoA transferase